MRRQKSKEIVAHYIKYQAIPDENDMRILDTHNHFLGRISEGRIYVYCVRCKALISTRISVNK